jgi:hypothetical protein
MEHLLLLVVCMNVLFRMVCLGVLVFVARKPQPPAIALQTGDVVFQTSKSSRSALIRLASNSPYSHVGLVEVTDGGTCVIEAISPVSRTPWATWYARGVDSKFTVIRAKHATPEGLAKVVEAAKSWVGRPYDAHYRWDDERLYCSELVMKAFKTIGIEAGTLQTVASLHVTEAQLKTAPSMGIDPQQTLVTPASIASDDDFTTVYSSWAAQ